jgi:hypothetical protein
MEAMRALKRRLSDVIYRSSRDRHAAPGFLAYRPAKGR